MNKSLTLSGVLESFRNGLDKEAAEAPEDNQVTDAAIEPEPEPQEVKTASESADAEVLKGIAKEAMEKEAASMQKEASEFGKLFAHSFIQEVEQDSLVKQAHAAAYQNTMDTLEEMVLTEKLAQVGDEARINTLLHLTKTSAYNETVDTLEKIAAEKFAGDLPLILAGITQEAYDETVKVLTDAKA
jgi:hypothetical protein